MAKPAETMNDAKNDIASREGKYLIFNLAREEYGICIQRIKEIIGMMAITTVPQLPEFVKGVINLRGKVIAVMDLRLKFGMEPINYTDRTCIVVTEIERGLTTVLIGVVVDAVSEVLNIKEEDIEQAPTFGARMNTDYILGMAKINNNVKILLDIDRVLAAGEVEDLKQQTSPINSDQHGR